MVAFDFSNIGVGQIIGLVLVIVVVPLGIWNMKRMKTKKMQEEDQFSSMGSSDIGAPSSSLEGTETQEGTRCASAPTSADVPENEVPLKIYIEQYKSQYSKDALRSALINNGYEAILVDTCLEKYF
jgi:hypothetical protein